MGEDKEEVYDIYVLRLSGLPIFAGCMGSDYCTEHMNNHELHGAFLTAIYAFSKEASFGTALKPIVFDTVQINIKVDEANDLMIAFVHPKEIEAEKIRFQLEAAHDLFLRKYKARLEHDDSFDEEEIFREFEKDLRNEKIVQLTRVFLRSLMASEVCARYRSSLTRL